LELRLDGFLREPVTINRDLKFPGEDSQTLSVIGMLVGDENSTQVFRRSTDPQQTLTNLPRAQSGIDEQAGVIGFEIGAVSAGTAGKDRKMRWHCATLESRR